MASATCCHIYGSEQWEENRPSIRVIVGAHELRDPKKRANRLDAMPVRGIVRHAIRYVVRHL